MLNEYIMINEHIMENECIMKDEVRIMTNETRMVITEDMQ